MLQLCNGIVIIQVCAEGEADQVSVVTPSSVEDAIIQDVAQDRIDLGEEEDQIAEESQLTEVFAEARDGVGGHHHHHHTDHGAAAAPAAAADSYDSPQAPPAPAPVAAEQYGAPQVISSSYYLTNTCNPV